MVQSSALDARVSGKITQEEEQSIAFTVLPAERIIQENQVVSISIECTNEDSSNSQPITFSRSYTVQYTSVIRYAFIYSFSCSTQRSVVRYDLDIPNIIRFNIELKDTSGKSISPVSYTFTAIHVYPNNQNTDTFQSSSFSNTVSFSMAIQHVGAHTFTIYISDENNHVILLYDNSINYQENGIISYKCFGKGLYEPSISGNDYSGSIYISPIVDYLIVNDL
jgi:hypothetical protein